MQGRVKQAEHSPRGSVLLALHPLISTQVAAGACCWRALHPHLRTRADTAHTQWLLVERHPLAISNLRRYHRECNIAEAFSHRSIQAAISTIDWPATFAICAPCSMSCGMIMGCKPLVLFRPALVTVRSSISYTSLLPCIKLRDGWALSNCSCAGYATALWHAVQVLLIARAM